MAFATAIQAQQYVFRAYRQADGLKNLAVNALTTDRSGFLWVATENGVYRFLGSSFQQYGQEQGIAERDIEDIYVDQGGAVWAGTDQNLYRWEGQRFVAVGKKPIQVSGAQHLAAEDARHLLVVDKQRLYRLEHDAEGRTLSYVPVFSSATLASIPALSQLSSVSITAGQTVWMGCGKKLCSWVDGVAGNKGAVTQWGTDKGVPENVWRCVVLDRAGTYWAVGQLHPIVVLTRGASRFVDRSVPGRDPDIVYQHSALVEDPGGRVTASTETGFARWEGKTWRKFGAANGLNTGHITSMAFDAAGDLWLGGFGHGLFHWIGGEDWEAWTALGGLPSANILSALPISQDRVLTGTEHGPAWIDPRLGSAGPLFSGKKWTYGQVSGIGTNPDGSIWAGTFSGAILRIDPKTGRVNETAKLPELIVGAVQDPAGRVFFSTAGGIYEREAGAINAAPHRIPAADALAGDSARVSTSCVAPNGAVWFLANGKLLRELADSWSAPPIDGLPKLGGPLLDLACAGDGALWATGLQTGAWRLTPDGSRVKAWQLALPKAFQSLAPLSILADRRGWVWLGTDWGLLVWNGLVWRHVTQDSGLIWNDMNKGILASGPDGSLWVETSGGLSHLVHPDHVFDSMPLAVSVTGVQRQDQDFKAGQPVVLPWAVAPLQFNVSSPNQSNRTELIFKYKMDGLQGDWIESRNGIAVFSALPPGNYTFMAMARNPGLDASSDVVKVPVKILPPWWRSYPFYIACGITLLLLLIVAGRLYTRRLHARSLQLETLVHERTLELELSREQLRVQATHDSLTGMLNRAAVLRALAAEMDRARREGITLVIALIDLDNFKLINDSYGHLAGDDALRWFASAVTASIRVYDYAGRYGGEEFLLLLTQVPFPVAEERLGSLHASISNLRVKTRTSDFNLNCSIGATVFNPGAENAYPEILLATADQALYIAKSEGRNRVVFRTPCPPNAARQSHSTTSS